MQIKMKVKDFLKGMKYISHIFVYKDNEEMQIGYPTDVKHIAHIGWDTSTVHGPAWMNQFSSDHSVPSMSLTSKYHDSIGLPMKPSQVSGDFDQHGGVGSPTTNTIATRARRQDIPKASKKNRKRKKTTKVSSPPVSRSSSRSSRSLDSFTSAFEEADEVYT